MLPYPTLPYLPPTPYKRVRREGVEFDKFHLEVELHATIKWKGEWFRGKMSENMRCETHGRMNEGGHEHRVV